MPVFSRFGGKVQECVSIVTMCLCVVACFQQEEDDTDIAGSGTEIGNVIGTLITPDERPASGVEVILYPADKDSSKILKTVTDSTGAFSFKVETGAFRLLAFDALKNGVTIDSLSPSKGRIIRFPNTRLAPLGGLKGFIKSMPNSGIGLILTLDGYPDTYLFPGNAEFLWDGIPAGDYWFRVTDLLTASNLPVKVTIHPGRITCLPDTVDLVSESLYLSTRELPYHLYSTNALFFPTKGTSDTVFWLLNGVEYENQDPYSAKNGDIVLTKEMLDSGRINDLQMMVRDHDHDSDFMVQNWKINLYHHAPKPWAYFAVKAVITELGPDIRTYAKRVTNSANPHLGCFRVLDKKRLTSEEMAFWEWSSVLDLDTNLPEKITATLWDPIPDSERACKPRARDTLAFPHAVGDTVTFFLTPDSILGSVAFRLKTSEKFEDLSHLAFYARANFPLFWSIFAPAKLSLLDVGLIPEGMEIRRFHSDYLETDSTDVYNGFKCLKYEQHFRIDSLGNVRERLAVPGGIIGDKLLLHYRWNIRESVFSDSLPMVSSYVYVDSSGRVVSKIGDIRRNAQFDSPTLEELKALVSELPKPIPAEWMEEYVKGFPGRTSIEDIRFLATDQPGILNYPKAMRVSPAKVEYFTRLENWLRSQGLF